MLDLVERAPVTHPSEGQREFADFFEEEYRRLAKAIYLLTGDPHEADDLAQESLVRVYERWPRVGAMESPVGYLYRTALNLHRSRLRRVARQARRSLAGVPPVGDPLAAVEERDEIGRLLAALPRGQREVLVLVEWLRLEVDDVARVLGITPSAVRMRLSRARSFLREHAGDSDG
jgi:RNA polymerase sigma-70 factor (sigma-E family)